MFFLSEIEHALRLPPHLLDQPLNEAIKGVLDSLFLDKVIEKLGLCISIYDIRSIDGGNVVPGEGSLMYTVKFRMVMFRPFVGEVLSARLKESTKDGLRLSMGFFDDIYIPYALLPTPNHYEPDPVHKGGVKWIWEYDENEPYPIDWTDEIRFKVLSVSYPPLPLEQGVDSNNEVPKDSDQKDSKVKTEASKDSDQKDSKERDANVKAEASKDADPKDSKETNSEVKALKGSLHPKQPKPFSPMVIMGSIDSEGFGPISWWV